MIVRWIVCLLVIRAPGIIHEAGIVYHRAIVHETGIIHAGRTIHEGATIHPCHIVYEGPTIHSSYTNPALQTGIMNI